MLTFPVFDQPLARQNGQLQSKEPKPGKAEEVVKTRGESQLFTPLKIANGKIELKHRVIHAALTRNRGTPVNPDSTAENPNRVWVPNDLMVEYYSQRATDGGLMITEGLPTSVEVRSMTSRLISF